MQKETSLVGTIISGDTYYVVPKVSGEILKIYVKNGDEVKKGDKISQLVIMPIITPDLELVEGLEETERGNNGFGSSGV